MKPLAQAGGEVWYLRHCDSPTLSAFTGDTVMLGPTRCVQLTSKKFMTAGCNAQVWGHGIQRHRARLKFA
jgi:hypothetical protein